MASARGLAGTQPVASITQWLACKTVYLCHLPGEEGWYMGGPGPKQVCNGMERGLDETAHSSTALHASLSNSEILGGSTDAARNC